MQWLKQIVIDLLAIVVIALAVFYDSSYLEYVVYIYTGLMVIARLFSLLSENFSAITQKKMADTPVWVYHLIYLINVGILISGGWYYTTIGWIFIWIAATIAHNRRK